MPHVGYEVFFGARVEGRGAVLELHMPDFTTRTRAHLAGLILVLQLPQVCVAVGELPADSEVAVIGSEHFTFSQLPASVQAELQESQSRYERQLHQLAIDHERELRTIVETRAGSFLDDKLMQMEARARNLSVQELAKEVKTPQVTDADVRSFYEQNKQQIQQPLEAVAVRITQYLTQQALERGKRSYADGLRVKYAARVTVEPLRREVSADGPSRGPKDAAVTIVEFADFQCPFCRSMAPLLKQLLDKYPREVRLVYRQLPLSDMHPDALNAAKASLCAGEQGRFWEMHDALFADPSALSLDALKKTAERLKMKPLPFAACLESEKTAAAMKADSQAALDYGVAGTPGLFINGRFINGAVPYEQLVATVEDELQRRTPRAVADLH
jgi:protein-disulfide isomerase